MDNSFYAALGAASLIVVIGAIALGVLAIIAWWKIFAKAGQGGWKIFIPVYNAYIQFKIAWGSVGFWITIALAVLSGIFTGLNGNADGANVLSVLTALCNIALAAMDVILMAKTAKAFGRGTGFAIGLIFLPTVFTLILGFGGSRYVGPNGIPENTVNY